MVEGNKADLDSPTWNNLIKLFEEAGVDLKKCFFSNVFMGLRDTEKMTGRFHEQEIKILLVETLFFFYFR